MLQSFNRGSTRYENIEELKTGIFAADLFYGPTAKVAHPTIFTRDDDKIRHHGWIRRPYGWRGKSGLIDGELNLGGDRRITFETKDINEMRTLMIKAVEVFL